MNVKGTKSVSKMLRFCQRQWMMGKPVAGGASLLIVPRDAEPRALLQACGAATAGDGVVNGFTGTLRQLSQLAGDPEQLRFFYFWGSAAAVPSPVPEVMPADEESRLPHELGLPSIDGAGRLLSKPSAPAGAAAAAEHSEMPLSESSRQAFLASGEGTTDAFAFAPAPAAGQPSDKFISASLLEMGEETLFGQCGDILGERPLGSKAPAPAQSGSTPKRRRTSFSGLFETPVADAAGRRRGPTGPAGQWPSAPEAKLPPVPM